MQKETWGVLVQKQEDFQNTDSRALNQMGVLLKCGGLCHYTVTRLWTWPCSWRQVPPDWPQASLKLTSSKNNYLSELCKEHKMANIWIGSLNCRGIFRKGVVFPGYHPYFILPVPVVPITMVTATIMTGDWWSVYSQWPHSLNSNTRPYDTQSIDRLTASRERKII